MCQRYSLPAIGYIFYKAGVENSAGGGKGDIKSWTTDLMLLSEGRKGLVPKVVNMEDNSSYLKKHQKTNI